MKNIKVIVLVLLLGSFVSCDKVLEELANDETVLLTKKLWTFESIEGFDALGNQFAATFLTGATYQFRADGTYTLVFLGQPLIGAWEFNSDKTVITLEPGTADAIEWSIITLSDIELKVTYAEEDAITGFATVAFN